MTPSPGVSADAAAFEALKPQQRAVATAAELFATQGYAATSIRQIARRARVSIDTMYALGGKAEIFLRALEVVFSGSTDGVPLLDGPGMVSVWQASTLEEVVGGLVEATARADARSVGIWSAFVEAASSDSTLATAMTEKNEAMRAEGVRTIEFLKERGMCAADLDTRRCADLIWADAHPSRFALLVGHAGWTEEEFSAQLTDRILSLIRPVGPL